MIARGAEFLQQHIQPLRLRNEDRRAQLVAQVDVFLAEQAQQIFRQQDADHIVTLAVHGGETRMRRFDDIRQDFLARVVDIDHVHLRARNHDFAHLHLGNLHDALDHRQRVGVEQIVFVGGVQEFEQLLAIVRLAREPGGQTFQETGAG